MLIGEAPGWQENKRERVFIGKTGMELNEHYLPIASLRRAGVYVTNAIKCLPPGVGGKVDINKQQDVDMLLSCAGTHLWEEIATVKPRVIVPMGAFACYAIDPDINLELQHGIPLETSWGMTFPMYHPAGGIHEPKKMLQIRNDWVRLRKYLNGTLRVPIDEHKSPDYREISADELLANYLECNDYTFPMAIDTEIKRNREAYCLTFSTAPGTGYLIRAGNSDALEIFQAIIDRWRGPLLFHNYPFDGPVCESMGLSIPFKRVVDTMTRCYHLGSLPQGLKALAYRLLGMRMQDFDDLVTPYSLPIALAYLREAYSRDWPKPMEQLIRDPEGLWKIYKPQAMGTKLKRFLTDYGKNPCKDIFGSWDNWEDSHQLIEEVMGPFPGKCISHVPFEKTIYYACRDADATVRLWPIQERMRRLVRRKPVEYWEPEAA